MNAIRSHQLAMNKRKTGMRVQSTDVKVLRIQPHAKQMLKLDTLDGSINVILLNAKRRHMKQLRLNLTAHNMPTRLNVRQTNKPL